MSYVSILLIALLGVLIINMYVGVANKDTFIFNMHKVDKAVSKKYEQVYGEDTYDNNRPEKYKFNTRAEEELYTLFNMVNRAAIITKEGYEGKTVFRSIGGFFVKMDSEHRLRILEDDSVTWKEPALFIDTSQLNTNHMETKYYVESSLFLSGLGSELNKLNISDTTWHALFLVRFSDADLTKLVLYTMKEENSSVNSKYYTFANCILTFFVSFSFLVKVRHKLFYDYLDRRLYGYI